MGAFWFSNPVLVGCGSAPVLLTFIACSAMNSPLLLFSPLFCVLPPEAATKYNKAEHLTLRDRLARLNTHSIAKKTMRLSRLLMHEAGIVAKVGSPPCYPHPCCPSWAPFWGILLL